MKWLQLIRLLLVYRKQVESYREVALELQRSYLDLALAFRIAIERPEIDLRDELDTLIRDLQDQLALQEEHIL